MDNQLLNAALKYREMGLSVIPVKKNKKPYIQWVEFQERKATSEEIRQWWGKWPKANTGIITGKISNLIVFDIDSEKGRKAIEEITPESFITPTASTPSGGEHRYCSYQDGISNCARFITDCDVRAEGGYIIAPPSYGTNGKPYAWHPGLSLEEMQPAAAPALYINNIYNSIKEGGIIEDEVTNNVPMTSKRLRVTSGDFKQGTRDEDLFHLANTLVKGGMGDASILKYMTFFAQHCKPPFPKKEIFAKIESAKKRFFKNEINISEEVRDFIVTSSGFFLTSDVFKRLQVTSRSEKKAVVLELLRLHKKGIIERHGNRSGCYRRVESECEDIDFLNASTENFNIKYPFQIEELVETMPGNLIIVAGEIESGKTSFLLNIAKLNMKSHPVYYFSSEMGASEMRKRLAKFDHMTLDDWKPLTVKARAGDFQDVIRPDAINLIDFLEVHDEFFKIGKPLKCIHDKLNKGVAIVAIQKPSGRDTGLGADRSMEVARLYISLFKDRPGTRLKIVKGKNWATDRNPNGLCLKYKTIDGCNLIRQSDWDRER